MSRIVKFFSTEKKAAAHAPLGSDDELLARFLENFSIEVMPRTAEKIDSFRDLLPTGTRVYIAHIEGTPIEDMLATARRIRDEGFAVMPHIPARALRDRAQLGDWIARYQGEAGIDEALLLAGGYDKPMGAFESSMDLMRTGLFGKAGFKRLHIAGHPEGNKDIDPDGSDRNVMEALRWKQAFAQTSDAQMAITTQFAFEAEPVIAWADRLRAEGIDLPIHIGVAGPAKLQTMIKYAMLCGVGPSLRVLQRRAGDIGKLLLPFTPTDFLAALARHKALYPDFNIERVHFFPLGGISKTADFVNDFSWAPAIARRANA